LSVLPNQYLANKGERRVILDGWWILPHRFDNL